MDTHQAHFSLLFVDDDPSVLSSLKRLFFEEEYEIHTAQGGREAIAILEKARVESAVVDLKMPGMDGLGLLREIRKRYPWMMVMILTGHGSVGEAVEAIKLGAAEFLEKPFSPEGLRLRVAQLCKMWELREENRRLREEVGGRFGFEPLVGYSRPILNLKQMILQIAPTDASILIQGETGTGKELVARAIHFHSRRSRDLFVPVDCAAIGESVIESELFGHVKGAFTGAHVSTTGLIRTADKGTLFLDEVGELSPRIQAKLLRTIQEREVRPVGSSRSYPADVRILAATNRRLEEKVAGGEFREDLYYRLNVLSLEVPPLRERRDDIPFLARYFIKELGGMISSMKDISQEAILCMEAYDWPGNVRELQNVVTRAAALGKGETILPDDLPAMIRPVPGPSSRKAGLPSDDSLRSYEKAAITNALARSGNNRRKAARILGIGEATLYRKIKSHGIPTGSVDQNDRP